jgi:hypothetical protein
MRILSQHTELPHPCRLSCVCRAREDTFCKSWHSPEKQHLDHLHGGRACINHPEPAPRVAKSLKHAQITYVEVSSALLLSSRGLMRPEVAEDSARLLFYNPAWLSSIVHPTNKFNIRFRAILTFGFDINRLRDAT